MGLRGVKQTDPENPILKSAFQDYARNLGFLTDMYSFEKCRNYWQVSHRFADVIVFYVERQYFVETRAQLLSIDK